MVEENKNFYLFTIRKYNIREANRSLFNNFFSSDLFTTLSSDLVGDTYGAIERQFNDRIESEFRAYQQAMNADDPSVAKEIYDNAMPNGGVFSDFFEKRHHYMYELQPDGQTLQSRLESDVNDAEALNALNNFTNSRGKTDGDLTVMRMLLPNESFCIKLGAPLIHTYDMVRDNPALLADLEKTVGEYLADTKYDTRASAIEGNQALVNKHSFTVREVDGEQKIQHSIENIDDTGLSLVFVGDKINIGHCNSPITEKEVKALARYCYHYGIEITDFKELGALRVVNEDDQDIGDAKTQFAEKNEILKSNDGEYPFDNNDEIEVEAVVAQEELDPALFVKKFKDLDVKRSKMQAKVQEGLRDMFQLDDTKLTRIYRDGNRTVISVYKSEDDMNADGKLDSKGKKIHSSRFAVFLDPTVPPKVSFYVGTDGKFEGDHARLLLGALKECGCKYFTYPAAGDEGGARVASFMEASVKELMVPKCKQSDDEKGVVLNANNMKKIFEVISKSAAEGKNQDDLLEYKALLLSELKGQTRWQKSKGKDTYALDQQIQKLERSMKFTKFAKKHIDVIKDYIKDGVDGKYGEKWDKVDLAAANAAMTEILKDINSGVLMGPNNKKVVFNPLDVDGKNTDRLLDAMAIYMKQKKPELVERINKDIAASDDTTSRIKSSVDAVLRVERQTLKDFFTDNIKTDDIDINFNLPDTTLFDPNRYKQMDKDEASHLTTGGHQNRTSYSDHKDRPANEWQTAHDARRNEILAPNRVMMSFNGHGRN